MKGEYRVKVIVPGTSSNAFITTFTKTEDLVNEEIDPTQSSCSVTQETVTSQQQVVVTVTAVNSEGTLMTGRDQIGITPTNPKLLIVLYQPNNMFTALSATNQLEYRSSLTPTLDTSVPGTYSVTCFDET